MEIRQTTVCTMYTYF